MPSLFSKLITDEEWYREAGKEPFRERDWVFWLELCLFLFIRSQSEELLESGGVGNHFHRTAKKRWKQRMMRSGGHSQDGGCSWSPLDTSFVCCFFCLPMLQKRHVKKLDASCEEVVGPNVGPRAFRRLDWAVVGLEKDGVTNHY